MDFLLIEATTSLPSSWQADANADGAHTSADVIYLINYLFVNGPATTPFQAGDVNSDGEINASDVVYFINYLFVGGPPPQCY